MWFKEKWFELVIGGFVIAFSFGYVVPTLNTIVGEQGKLAGQFTALEKRVGRIATGVNHLGVNIAYERIYSPFAAAVIITKPFQTEPGQWRIYVHYINPLKNQLLTFDPVIDGPDDKTLKYQLAGALYDLDKSALSVGQIQTLGTQAKIAAFAPNFVDEAASLISYESSEAILARMNGIKGWNPNPVKTRSLRGIGNWSDLAVNLKSNASWFSPER